MKLTLRRILRALSDDDGSNILRLLLDPMGALWVADSQGQPAQTQSALSTGTVSTTFRAVEVDGAVGASGQVVMVVNNVGGGGTSTVTRNVQAGQIYPWSSAMIVSITSIGAGLTLFADG